MKTLQQKHWPEFKNYRIEENGLRLDCREQDQLLNMLVEFDQIGNQEIVLNKKAHPYGTLAFIAVTFNILFIIYLLAGTLETPGLLSGVAGGLVVGISLWARHLFHFSREKVIQGPQPVSFFYRKADREDVDRFIKELQRSKEAYIRKKYMRVDPYTPSDSLRSRFIWLRQNGYINEEEIKQLMQDLENRKLISGE